MRPFAIGGDFNWRYALGEIFLIVVGVTIALAASSWYEGRKDRIDEQLFISRLHEDIQLAEELTSRVRDRRLGLLKSLIDASDVIYGRAGRKILNDIECNAIGDSSNFNINISDLPSLAELVSTGRMAIIQDGDLRIALVALQQIKGTLPLLIDQLESNTSDLTRSYPGLIQNEAYIESDTGEVRTRSRCDSDKIRANQTWVNHFAVNIDQYDVYIRDGLKPWLQQIDKIHQIVDESMGIQHD